MKKQKVTFNDLIKSKDLIAFSTERKLKLMKDIKLCAIKIINENEILLPVKNKHPHEHLTSQEIITRI